MAVLAPHPDRLLPTDPSERAVARRLYDAVAHQPIISPHGHVDAGLLLADEPFGDPATLLITSDHYVTRLLHAVGVSYGELGLTDVSSPDRPRLTPREVWRRFCENWHAFLGTPVRYWLEEELFELFGLTSQPSEDAADETYDQLAAILPQPQFRPRALFHRFGCRVLATTDDPADDLKYHVALAADQTFSGRVIPTFRPDAYLDPAHPDWPAALQRLGIAADIDTDTYTGFLSALRARRQYFVRRGATASDQSPLDLGCSPLTDPEAERIHAAALRGRADAADLVAYRHNMLFQCAAMATEDRLVMQLHPGVLRNHHRPTLDRFGPDTGHDLPVPTEFVRPLRPLLEAFGTHRNLHLVLFTVDETAFSREIAPLASFYPSVYVGAPWWFLDTPSAMRRFREAVTDSAGFYKTAGFVDDTRAFCSIPARHDMSRRVDASFLAHLVCEHRLSEEDATSLARDLVGSIVSTAFRLD